MAEIFKSGAPERDRLIEPSTDPSRQLTVFERKLLQVKEEAENLRAEAQREAENLIAKAKEQAESISAKAYEEGLDKGKGEAISLIEQLAASLQGEIDKLGKAQVELLKKCRGNIVDFSLKLAKLIICDELKTNPALVEKQLERIFERLSVDGKVDIYISSEDYETIDTFMRESGASMAPNGYEIKVDSSMGRGGVKVEAPTMGVEASLEGMLERVEGVVRDLLNEDG